MGNTQTNDPVAIKTVTAEEPAAAQTLFVDALGSIAAKSQGPAPADIPNGTVVTAADKPATSGTANVSDTSKLPAPADENAALRNKLTVAVKALKQVERNVHNLVRLLEEQGSLPLSTESAASLASRSLGEGGAGSSLLPPLSLDLESVMPTRERLEPQMASAVDGRVIEGVFDGQHMVGSDGKAYIVPANYASKSKLVEGDMLKLTITPKGSFIYKQIGPIERQRVMATLGFDPTIGEYYGTAEKKRWNVIKASVTYFKGESGDEIILLVPKNAPSKWAAVENVIKRDPLAA